MNTVIRSFFAAAATVALFASPAGARELDREKSVSAEQIEVGRALPKTLVVRYKKGSGRAEVLHMEQVLKPDRSSRGLVSTSSFVKLDSRGRMTRELDRDSSRSSWWFGYRGWGYGWGYGRYSPYYASTYYPSYYYPTYGYGGYYYPYTPYYSYYSAPYYYSYYGWPYYNSYCGGYY